MAEVLRRGRSLAETPTYSVASVITVMVFVCFVVERSIYRFGKWLKKTRRKALFASLEKIKEELMLLGLISLLLAQSARWISEICVNSSLFNSEFYICSEKDLDANQNVMPDGSSFSPDETDIPKGLISGSFNQCPAGHEPFVSYEGLEQLHRFLFVLGITHVLYSCLAVGLAMSKIYSWRRWENQTTAAADGNLQGLNIYFWLSFIPAMLVMLIGTKLQHVVSTLALEIMEQQGPLARTQVKPRDDLFWFKKPEILLWLIQFVIFQNAFEMATFIWSLWGLEQKSCFMKNHYMIIIRLASGVLVQFWCSYMTVPLNVIVSQMGSRCKKALVTESVRDSLHSWCKRVKQKSKHDHSHHTARSVCSLESTIDERDEITVVSGTLTRSSSLDLESLNQITVTSVDQLKFEASNSSRDQDSMKVAEYLSKSVHIDSTQPPDNGEDHVGGSEDVAKAETLSDLFQKT
ncbi:hypothetical protein Ahy_A04g021410 [Arachis hypogaea]|uniref:MLO-like protein n=1 Tax=Arachis hypogaea TaxID=3818 RepID=A0A445DK80_ARAHY|nr:hypothetical protein Ahy_A04g021410 [Arachis hypogaea]